jgi:hypothetical protein
VAPIPVTQSRKTCCPARRTLRTAEPPAGDVGAHAAVSATGGVTRDARATVEYFAGTVMIGFGVIFLVVLGDVALGAFIAGAAFTKALIMRLLVPGAVFTGGVLFGAWLTRSSAREL